MKTKNIGIEIKSTPSKEFSDVLCPFHGNIKRRGRMFTGVVISDKMNKTVTVQWDRTEFVPKFERYIKKRSKVKAHSPECLEVKTGDIVKISETRPISKTKNFVVIEKLGIKQRVESDEALSEEKAKSQLIKSKVKKEEAAQKKAAKDKE